MEVQCIQMFNDCFKRLQWAVLRVQFMSDTLKSLIMLQWQNIFWSEEFVENTSEDMSQNIVAIIQLS